jgi:hypothetical protein
MSKLDLKKLWQEQTAQSEQHYRFDNKALDKLRDKSSDRIQENLKKGIRLDSTLKSILNLFVLAIPYLGDYQTDYMVVAGIALVIINSAYFSNYLVMRQLKKLPMDLPVLEKIKQRLIFMKSRYSLYLVNSAFTSVMMVFVGNVYYFHFKYGEMRFDLVLVGFLVLAFAIGYLAQLPLYQLNKNELTQLLGDFDEQSAHEIEVKKFRLMRWGIYTIAAGCLLLAFVIVLY